MSSNSRIISSQSCFSAEKSGCATLKMIIVTILLLIIVTILLLIIVILLLLIIVTILFIIVTILLIGMMIRLQEPCIITGPMHYHYPLLHHQNVLSDTFQMSFQNFHFSKKLSFANNVLCPQLSDNFVA